MISSNNALQRVPYKGRCAVRVGEDANTYLVSRNQTTCEWEVVDSLANTPPTSELGLWKDRAVRGGFLWLSTKRPKDDIIQDDEVSGKPFETQTSSTCLEKIQGFAGYDCWGIYQGYRGQPTIQASSANSGEIKTEWTKTRKFWRCEFDNERHDLPPLPQEYHYLLKD